MGSKIRKRAPKQDKFVKTTFEITDWARDNQRTAILTSLAVILIFVLGYSYKVYNDKKGLSAANALYRSMQSYRSGNYALAASDLESLLDEHSGSSVEDQALYYLANSYYKAGDLDKAEGTLSRFREDFGDNSRVSLDALITLACVQEQKGELEKAAGTFIQAASRSRFPYQEKDSRIAAARLFIKTGDYQKAIEQYDALIDGSVAEKISSAELDQIEMRKAELRAMVQTGVQ